MVRRAAALDEFRNRAMQFVPFHGEHFAEKDGLRHRMTKAKSHASAAFLFDQNLTIARLAERLHDRRFVVCSERHEVFEAKTRPQDCGALEDVARIA